MRSGEPVMSVPPDAQISPMTKMHQASLRSENKCIEEKESRENGYIYKNPAPRRLSISLWFGVNCPDQPRSSSPLPLPQLLPPDDCGET